MNMIDAFDATKSGEYIRLPEWQGSTKYIYFEENAYVSYLDNTKRKLEPCNVLHTADGKLIAGWIPSPAESKSNDWEIVPVAELLQMAKRNR